MTSALRMRAALGRWASRLVPGLDDRAFNRARDRSAPASRAPRGGYSTTPFQQRPTHLVVVPQEGPLSRDWRPGTRNLYYEAFRSAAEIAGADQVSVLEVGPDDSPAHWHQSLIDHVRERNATHILTHIETDPSASSRWTWDVLWNQLAPQWDGVLLGVMFDSAFDLITMQSRRLARMSPQFMAVDICTSLDGVLMRGRSEVGPVTMPVSQESLDLVNRRMSDITPVHDVSFIGALYPYRVACIEELRALGIDVVVNPHRPDVTTDFASSRTNQPGWLDYMAGLAGSRMTINFSRSSAGAFEQLKTRVIEAALAGSLLLTDDVSSTRLFFQEGTEFGHFTDVTNLPSVIETWLGDPEALDLARSTARKRAQGIALYDFWHGINRGLRARDLPELFEVPDPGRAWTNSG